MTNQICHTVIITSDEYAELKNAEKRAARNYKDAIECTTLLAASKAREKVLRETLSDETDVWEDLQAGAVEDGEEWMLYFSGQRLSALSKTLAQPTDDTALKAAINIAIAEFLESTGQYVTNDASRNAALAAERERCAKVCDDLRRANYSGETGDWIDGTEDCAKAIRAIGYSDAN